MNVPKILTDRIAYLRSEIATCQRIIDADQKKLNDKIAYARALQEELNQHQAAVAALEKLSQELE